MTSSELKEFIKTSFSATPYPNGKLTNTEFDEGVSAYFEGRSWQSFEPKELRKYCAAISLFEAEAFRYFLPAFILAELNDHAVSDVIGQFIVYAFGKPKDYWVETYEQRLAVFSYSEKCAVLEFLDYMQETYGGFESEVIYASSRLG
jgi:hypothetical protein